jgi:hypothetical protein
VAARRPVSRQPGRAAPARRSTAAPARTRRRPIRR